MCIRDRKYIDNSEPGEGLLIFENVVLPFSNPIPKNTQLYKICLLYTSEYWAQRKGQAKLDKEAAALPAEEQPAKPTKIETDKEKLRQAIRTRCV